MTTFVSKLGRVRCYQETAFATDYSGSIASFLEVPFVEGSAEVTLTRPVQTPGHAQQYVDGYPLGVLMPKSAKLVFECNLETFTTKATSTVASGSDNTWWLGVLLRCALGHQDFSTGTVITTGASTTSLPLTVATTFLAGGAVGLNTGAGNALEIREIKSKSGSTLALKLASSNAAGNGATVLGCATFCTDPANDGTGFKSIQFAVEGANTEDRWLLRGGWLDSLVITTAPGGIPRLKFTWSFATWDQADGAAVAATLRGVALAAATYIDNVTVIQADSEYRVATVGSTSLSNTLLKASSMEFVPNIKMEAIRSPGGTNTVLTAQRVHAAPVIHGSFTIPYEDSQVWYTARDNRTAMAVFYQIGSSTTYGGWLIAVPTIQIIDVQRHDVGGIISSKVDWQGRLDADTTVGTDASLGMSAFRMHAV